MSKEIFDKDKVTPTELETFSDGYECLRSEEFQAFAIKWLGFNPWGDGVVPITGIDISIHIDDAVRFSLRHLGQTRLVTPEERKKFWDEALTKMGGQEQPPVSSIVTQEPRIGSASDFDHLPTKELESKGE